MIFEKIIEKQIVFGTHTWRSWVSLQILLIVFCNCSAWKRATEKG